MPVIAILVAVTVLLVPTFLSAYVGVPETVSESPEIRLSVNVTDALIVPSYVLLLSVKPNVIGFCVMSAVVVGAPTVVTV